MDEHGKGDQEEKKHKDDDEEEVDNIGDCEGQESPLYKPEFDADDTLEEWERRRKMMWRF
jgi:hypothetical protein